MRCFRFYKSGVLIPVFFAVIGTSAPVFSDQSDGSPEKTNNILSFQPPVEERATSTGSEGQYQLQVLQKEIMDLRGQVEVLIYDLSRLKSTQDDRYLDLDARLQQLLKASVAQTQLVSEDKEPGEHSLFDGDISEKDAYQTTQSLIRNKQYEMSIIQLEEFIERFPEGVYTANAYYWLGQVQAAKTNPDFEKAREALAQVISYFPEHRKVPDAAYALGKVYYMLGDCERATELLQQVVNQYPSKSAAKLAGNFLRDSMTCDN
jgi:tol-pal system protein YbgF